jgi:glucokinase
MSRDRSAGRTLLAGVDVGGTKVAAIVVDGDGRLVGRAVRSMAARPVGVEPIVDAIRAALDAAGAQDSQLGAIGVGVPGRVDPDSGVVNLATNLDWDDMPVGSLLETAFGVTCQVENDVHLAAAGLLDHEAAGGARSLAYVAIGTGIGAGIVINGQLYRGARGMAGEIGHVIADPEGVLCRCGQSGCLETFASGPAIARRAAEALTHGTTPSSLRAVPTLSAKSVYDAARAGDTVALDVARETGVAVARALAGLLLTCDLERVLLGGGVAAAGPVFMAPVLAELDRLRDASSLVAEVLPPEAVQLLPAQFDAVAWGGVALARRSAAENAANLQPDVEIRDGLGEEVARLEEEVVARETLA